MSGTTAKMGSVSCHSISKRYIQRWITVKRAVKSKFVGMSDPITEFRTKLDELKAEFRDRLALHTGTGVNCVKTKVMRVLKQVEEIGTLT